MTGAEIVARAIGHDDLGDEWRMWLGEAELVVRGLEEKLTLEQLEELARETAGGGEPA